MSVYEYLDMDLLAPVFHNDIPLIQSARVDAICKELRFAIKNKNSILVYGDYDMDGFCCMLVWKEVLAPMRANVSLFKYGNRTHKLDRDVIRQAKLAGASHVIVCDTGSSEEDYSILRLLRSEGITPIVIDHHVHSGNYIEDAKTRLLFNSREESAALYNCEVSGAYASLLVAKVLCDKYMNVSVPYNAQVYALASMYSDVVDLSSLMGRALYNVVAQTKADGPMMFRCFNEWNYMMRRRLFSFIISPKINACFRSEKFEMLNELLQASSIYQVKPAVQSICDNHVQVRELTRNMAYLFERTKIGNILLCTHEVTDETRALHIRNFTGVIATRISKEEVMTVVVVVKDDRHYEGSVRDYHNRHLLNYFSAFCNAQGHHSAFGISFSDLEEFKKSLELLSRKLPAEWERPYVSLSTGLVSSPEEINAIALYNEYMNTKPKVVISHYCSSVELLRVTKWSKYYDLGIYGHKVKTTRHISEGSHIMLEPMLCRGVEIHEME